MPWPTPQDYNEEVQNPHICFADAELRKGEPERTPLGLPRPITGAFAVVYRIKCGSHNYAVRCFQHDFADQQRRYAEIDRHLDSVKLPYTVGFDFISQGIKVKGNWYPILKMEWVKGELLNDYIKRNLNNPSALLNLANRWLAMINTLQKSNIAHGDLQHGNILVVNGDLKLIDYDGMFVPGLAGESSHEIGHRNYQHPNRTASDFGSYTDHFSAWVIYISLLLLSIDSKLWQQVNAGDEFILFRGEDFKEPSNSHTFNLLTGHIDTRIQLLTTFFQGLLYLNPRQIQPLDDQILESNLSIAHNSTFDSSWLSGHLNPTQVSNAGKSAIQVDWIKDHTNQASFNRDASLPSGNSTWVLDFISTPSATNLKTFNPQTKTPRITTLLSTVLFAVLAVTCYFSAAFPLYYMVFVAIILFFINRWIFISFYKRDSIVIEMVAITDSEEEQQNFLTSLEQIVKDQEEKKAKLHTLENKKRSVIDKRTSDLRNKERQEKEKIEKELKQVIDAINNRRLAINRNEADALRSIQETLGFEISRLNRQIASIPQAEAENLTNALNMIQNLFIESYLKQSRIMDASIPGIGEKLKSRLLDKGIYTAEDAEWYRVINVDGIGLNKANAIVAWRERLILYAKTRMPQSLSLSDANTIKSKYKSQKLQLEGQRDNTQRRLTAEENIIRGQHAEARQTLDAEQSASQSKANQELQAIIDQYASEYAPISKELAQLIAEFSNEYRQIDESMAQVRKRLSECHWQLAKIRRELGTFRNISFKQYIRKVILGSYAV